MLADYHSLTQPFAYLAFVAGFIIMLLYISSFGHKNRISLLLLAFFWAWNGLILFTYKAAALAPVTYALQGFLFPLEAMLLGYMACLDNPPDFDFRGITGKAGLIIMFTAVFLYPVLGNIFGHSYPAAPVFPEPCPLTIFTFGFLLGARNTIPIHLLIIPFFWSLMGIVAVVKLGVKADALEVLVGVVCMISIVLKNRSFAHQQIVQ